MNKQKKLLFLLITNILTILLCKNIFALGVTQDQTAQNPVYYKGEVKKHIDVAEEDYFSTGEFTKVQIVEVLLKEGKFKDTTVIANFDLNYAMKAKYTVPMLKEGDLVVVNVVEDEFGEPSESYVVEIARERYLVLLIGFFILSLLVIGKMKGLKAIISLTLTGVGITYFLIPGIMSGSDPVFLTIIMSVLVITLSLIIISGFNLKTLSAILGTTGGVIVAGLMAIIIGNLAKLTGYGSEDALMLMNIPNDIVINFKGLLFSGIIIGAMGATMDVGMSIASALHEIKENSPDITTKKLISAGMNVGRDTMATMANTLILAYVGSSLPLMLLFVAYNTSIGLIINWEMIFSEILRAVAGSIGIIFAIPITTFSSAFIEKYIPKKSSFKF